MHSINDKIKLCPGSEIPCLGFGTYKTPAEETEAAVRAAIELGYRHIDTAAYYRNEHAVGAAVRGCGVPREEIFVTSKVWNTNRGYDKTMAAFEETMNNLGLEYLDLYLIHWPANRKQFGDKAKSINSETWRALEELYRAGKVRAIGLSNFMPHHIEELLETAEIKPMINQIEFHPGWAQTECASWCHDHGIAVEAWSPLGRKDALENEVILEIAQKHEKTAAQVCLRWVLQHGIIPLPKSVKPARMEENSKIFDFALDLEDMEKINALRNIGGQCSVPDEVDF